MDTQYEIFAALGYLLGFDSLRCTLAWRYLGGLVGCAICWLAGLGHSFFEALFTTKIMGERLG